MTRDEMREAVAKAMWDSLLPDRGPVWAAVVSHEHEYGELPACRIERRRADAAIAIVVEACAQIADNNHLGYGEVVRRIRELAPPREVPHGE